MNLDLWNCLHDGTIERVELVGANSSDLILTVEIEYLRSRLTKPGTNLLVHLHKVSLFDLENCATKTHLTAHNYETLDFDILEAKKHNDVLAVYGTQHFFDPRSDDFSILSLVYEKETVHFEDGTLLPPRKLFEAAEAYWKDFGVK